jgi:hypothetical protein
MILVRLLKNLPLYYQVSFGLFLMLCILRAKEISRYEVGYADG